MRVVQFVLMLMQMNWMTWAAAIELWICFLFWILFRAGDQSVLIPQIEVVETLQVL